MHRPRPVRALDLLPKSADHVDHASGVRGTVGPARWPFLVQPAKVQVLPRDAVRYRTDRRGNDCTFKFTEDSAFVNTTALSHTHTNETRAPVPPARPLSLHQRHAVPVSARANKHVRQTQPPSRLANLQSSGARDFSSRSSFLSTVLAGSAHAEPAAPQIVQGHAEHFPNPAYNGDLLQRQNSRHSPPSLMQGPPHPRQGQHPTPQMQTPASTAEDNSRCVQCAKKHKECKPRAGKDGGQCNTCYKSHIKCSLSNTHPIKPSVTKVRGTRTPGGVETRKRTRNHRQEAISVGERHTVSQTFDKDDSEELGATERGGEDVHMRKRKRLRLARRMPVSTYSNDVMQVRPVSRVADVEMGRILSDRAEYLKGKARRSRVETKELERRAKDAKARAEKFQAMLDNARETDITRKD